MASNLKFALAAALGAACLSVSADTIYQSADPFNTSVYSAKNSATGEIGDEVVLSNAGFQFTGLTFKYNSNYALTGGLQISIYSVDGSRVPDLSNPLFRVTDDIKSGAISATVSYDVGNFYLPERFVYSVKFAGLDATHDAGLILGGQATVGASGDDVGGADGSGGWPLVHVTGNYANFNASVTGNVPEPTTVALASVGAAALGFVAYRRNRK
ncbi:MAG TPA: PEP-CTERM sorting domain-containing protein [Candidatus Limnocylindria bacterium]|jgi:hypothetical protein|nr:PEP-CTERM sorting domain-containing protein [Candidatus Limnocylindria bacterium]